VSTIDDLVRNFRLAALEKGDEGGQDDDLLYQRLRTAFRQLRALGPAGAHAFRSLLKDPAPPVRGWVAAQLLGEGDLEALRVVEELAASAGIGGFNAQMVLKEHRAGRLKPPFGDAAA
jgi:hypothetical protein